MDGKFKTLEKEPVQSASVKVFSCGTCGSSLQLRAQGFSQVVVCSYCGSISDAKSEAHDILVRSSSVKQRCTQYLKLGSRGKLHGSLWEVIGYMERSDTMSVYWSEYLLFNPRKGFRWLVESNGHWSYVLMTKEKPNTGYIGMATYNGNDYHLFHKGVAQIVYVVGEFYWQAIVGEKVEVSDFIRNNEILSCETNDSEKIWSVGEYAEADTIKKAFNLSEMPLQFGVAPNQPNGAGKNLSQILTLYVIFALILIAIQFGYMLKTKNTIVMNQTFTHFGIPPFTTRMSTPPFDVSGPVSNLQIQLDAPVNNNWLYMQGQLVNVDTGEEVEFEQGVEFYSGYDSEGIWSEGSQTSEKNFPAIEPGRYQINFETSSDAYNINLLVKVNRNVLLWQPFLYAFVLLSSWPLFLAWRMRSFNLKKWSDSDYSPYAQYSGDDE